MMLSYACIECGKTFHRYTRMSGPPPSYCSGRCRKRAQRRRLQLIANATTPVANATTGLQSTTMSDTPNDPAPVDPGEPVPVDPEPVAEPEPDDDRVSPNQPG